MLADLSDLVREELLGSADDDGHVTGGQLLAALGGEDHPGTVTQQFFSGDGQLVQGFVVVDCVSHVAFPSLVLNEVWLLGGLFVTVSLQHFGHRLSDREGLRRTAALQRGQRLVFDFFPMGLRTCNAGCQTVVVASNKVVDLTTQFFNGGGRLGVSGLGHGIPLMR
ncbi:hypothetical protein D3C73_1188970 [compost metagenome]